MEKRKRLKLRIGGLALLLASGGAIGVTASSSDASLPLGLGSTDAEVLERSARAFNELAKRTTPAVVSINAVKAIPVQEGAMGFPFGALPPGAGSPGEVPPGLFQAPGQEEGVQRTVGIGSGVLIRQDGLVLTNHHVVEHAEKVTVAFDEHREYKAVIVGADPKTDLAVLKLVEGKRKSLPTLAFGNSSEVQVGDLAVAIGNPFGLSHSVTSGIVSAKGRGQMGETDIDDFIQTDAAVNPGNSGGPLLNFRGEIIGINTAIFSQTGGNMGIGFAIPSNVAKDIAQQIVDKGRVVRGWIGVAAQDIDKDLAKYFKAPNTKGTVLTQITPQGPASRGGLTIGDVIVRFNDKKVERSADLRNFVAKSKVGASVPLVVVRKGQKVPIQLVVSEHPDSKKMTQQAGRAAKEPAKKISGEEGYGLSIQELPGELAQVLALKQRTGAMIVGVQPGSAAFNAGLAPGDVILKANDRSMKTAGEFKRFARGMNAKDLAVLYIQRGPEEKFFVPLKQEG